MSNHTTPLTFVPHVALVACLALGAPHASASEGFHQVDSNAVLGGAIGGGAGAAIGSAIGGRNGAIIGGAIGAGTGVAVATPQQRETRVVHEYHDHDYHQHHDRGHHYGHYKRGHRGHEWHGSHRHDD